MSCLCSRRKWRRVVVSMYSHRFEAVVQRLCRMCFKFQVLLRWIYSEICTTSWGRHRPLTVINIIIEITKIITFSMKLNLKMLHFTFLS